MEEALGYFAMITGSIAALLVSANLGRRVTGWAFVVFTASSVAWIAVGLLGDQPPLWIQNIVLTAINIFGIYRWLIRKKPDGAEA